VLPAWRQQLQQNGYVSQQNGCQYGDDQQQQQQHRRQRNRAAATTTNAPPAATTKHQSDARCSHSSRIFTQ